MMTFLPGGSANQRWKPRTGRSYGSHVGIGLQGNWTQEDQEILLKERQIQLRTISSRPLRCWWNRRFLWQNAVVGLKWTILYMWLITMKSGANPSWWPFSFELLCLETYQSGLSWETVLNKRQGFREVFYNYQFNVSREMTDGELEALLENPAIIRNRAKLFATRANAQAFTSSENLWLFWHLSMVLCWGKTIVNDVPDYHLAPAKTALSEKLSQDLKNAFEAGLQRGFKFAGPIAVLAFYSSRPGWWPREWLRVENGSSESKRSTIWENRKAEKIISAFDYMLVTFIVQ